MSADPARALALARLLQTPLGRDRTRPPGLAAPSRRARASSTSESGGTSSRSTPSSSATSRTGVARVEPRLARGVAHRRVPAALRIRSARSSRRGLDRDARGHVLEEGLRQRRPAQAGDRAGDRHRRAGAGARARRGHRRPSRGGALPRCQCFPDFEADLVAYLVRAVQPDDVVRRDAPRARRRRDRRSPAGADAAAAPRGPRQRAAQRRRRPPRRRLRASGATVLRQFWERHRDAVRGSIAECPPFREGLVTVQDLVASEVARFVGAAPGRAHPRPLRRERRQVDAPRGDLGRPGRDRRRRRQPCAARAARGERREARHAGRPAPRSSSRPRSRRSCPSIASSSTCPARTAAC